MKKETALSIGNYLPSMKAIEDWVADRTQQIYKLMELESDIQEIYKHQGAIRELKKLLTIRDTALKVLEQEMANGRRAKESDKKGSYR